MPWIATHELTPEVIAATPISTVDQLYNSLDVCVTLECFEEILATQGNRPTPIVYDFARAMQAPALEMMLRGFKVNAIACERAKNDLRAKLTKLQSILNTYAHAVWEKDLNPRSPKQLKEFFYGAMRIPEIVTYKKGDAKLSMDREVLEKLQAYFYAMPIIEVILAFREIAKKLEVLETEVDPDGRMRTSYNIAGTETGRWSSSTSAQGSGTNLQNITEELRYIFEADPGKKLCGIDLEQAESREVGWRCGLLFGDWSYLDACESGDLHTTVAKMTWSEMPWPADLKLAKALAEEPFYRHLSRRDMSKKLGHGSNYYGQPPTMARHAKIATKVAEDFQANYFGAFPGIPKWHGWVAEQIQTKGFLVTPFQRTRYFFGRTRDDATLREAIAFDPQSSTGDRLNLGLWRVWHKLGKRVEIIAQVHDALYFQYDERENEAEIIGEALRLLDTTLTDPKTGRKFTVPGEAKVGWNWGKFDKKNPTKNPDGLKVFSGKDERKRTSLLEQVM